MKYDDKKVEVLVKADNLGAFDNRAKDQIVEIVLINLLGEKIFMEKIDFIDVVEGFESEKGVTELRYLPDHLMDETYFA